MTNRKPCSVDDCPGAHAAHGLCITHYRRLRRRGTIELPPPPPPKGCSVEGCSQPFLARDLCGKHYARLRNTGTVEKRQQRPDWHSRPLRAALAALPSDDCVLWTGYVGELGYCTVRVGDGVQVAHRRVYELLVGPVPDDLHLDHLCHNADLTCAGGVTCAHRRCVNPAHLEPVTPQENDARARARPTYVQPNRWLHRTG